MKARPEEGCPADLDLVLFSVGSVRYGVDASQVASIEALQGSVPEGSRWFHELQGLRTEPLTSINPVVLTLHGGLTGIAVDGLEDIVRVPLSDLRPFPPLTELAARSRGLWAVAKRDEQLILLVDFHLLAATIAPWNLTQTSLERMMTMRFKLRTKVMGLIIVCAALIVTVVTALNSWTIVKRGNERVTAYRETLLNERRRQIRTSVELATRVLENLPKDQALTVAATMRYGEDGYIWVQDFNNFMFVHPSPVLRGSDQSDLKDPNGVYIIREITKVCKEKGEGFISYMWKKPGHEELIPKLSFAKTLPSRQWIVGTGIYVEDVDASVVREQALVRAQGKDAIFQSLGITLVMTVSLVGGALILIQRNISGPVEAITRTMANFNNDLTLTVPITTSDEIGELARWINNHIKKLHQIISLVSEATGKIYVSGGTIAFTMEQQASFTTELSSSVVEIASTMEEFSSTASEIAQHSQHVVERADRTLEDTRLGSADVEDLAIKISNINDGIQNSLAEIVELGRKSSEINKVMEIINNIANQTRLIAFNAALEAASAGESGKRFGVVALEIRRLADSVVESTGEIDGRITEILDAVNRLVMTSEKSSHLVGEGLEHADRTVKALSGILTGVEATTDAARQISLSTQQQQIASGQVVLALKDIEKGVKSSTLAIRNSKDATSELTEFSHRLRELVDGFKLNDNKLQNG